MTKTIQTSSDNITFNTLPGSTGDFNLEAEGITDTIFGQPYNSTETGLANWTTSANSYWKGHAGYVATIKKSGTSTAFDTSSQTGTFAAFTFISGETYQITDATMNVWDRTATFAFFDDNGLGVSTPITASVQSIDYLYGTVTFVAGTTAGLTGSVTGSGNYLPMAAYGVAREFTLTQNANTIETTDFDTAQSNGGFRTYTPGLRQVSLDLSGFYDAVADFKTLLSSRAEVVIEIAPDGTTASVCRGFFKLMSTGQSGEVGATEDETATFQLSVPYSNTETITAFSWNHTATTSLPTAVRTCLDAWESDSAIYVKYLYDGVAGYTGSVVITDFSLTSGLSAMNEFAFSGQGSGAYTAV